MSLFALSGSQANGILVLLPLLFLLMMSNPIWRWWQRRQWTPDPGDIAQLDSLAAIWSPAIAADSSARLGGTSNRGQVPQKLQVAYFTFDPNAVSVPELIRLGFQERLAQRIEHYRTRGGVFKSKEDLLKIYGMDTAQFERVYDFIRIARNHQGFKKAKSAFPARSTDKFPRQFSGAPVALHFDINKADTARMEAVRGIGEKLSRRIIKYRSSLGGFVDIRQLKEVFGLDSGVVKELQKTAFVAPDFLPDRIDINAADEKLLEAHPYLNRQEARAIVAYRFQHGRFGAVSDLRKLPMFDDEKVRQIGPYLMAVE